MKPAARSLFLMLSLIALLPLTASAHIGVGHTSGFWAGVTHPVSGIDHLLAMVAIGLWAAMIGGRAVKILPVTFVSVMVAGGMLAMVGITLPFVEAGIILSVVVLGLLILGARRYPLAVSMMLVGLFAIFHGHAHGTEIPVAAGALTYSLGFALSTLLLHLSGILVGMSLNNIRNARYLRYAGAGITLAGIVLVAL